jgi:U3 small nucleolar ribonucleoprotein protein LCP5
MVDYMTNLTYVMLRKSFGKAIENDPSIERLVEARTIMEKMRPIEKKLKYQVCLILRSLILTASSISRHSAR